MQKAENASSSLPIAIRATSPVGHRQAKRPAPIATVRSRRFPVSAGPLQPIMVDQRMQKFAVADDPRSSYPGIETFTPLGHACHYRIHGATAQAFGEYEFCGLDDGLFVVLCDTTYIEPLQTLVVAEDMLRVRVASDGDGEYVTGHGDLLDMKGPTASIIIEPAGQPAAETVLAGRVIALEIYVHRVVLGRLYARDDHELPATVRAFLAGDLQKTMGRRLPLNARLLRFLDDLKGCTLEGHSRRLVIRAKAIEILCHAFEALMQDENGEGLPEASKLATCGVLKAQRLLAENFVAPPSLNDLAHEVGMSRSGLCAAFRRIVGQSVFDYVADLRMQRALTLLNQRDATIAEVAYAVGYGHPSSFSDAVQRRFGTTASELRQRGLPPL